MPLEFLLTTDDLIGKLAPAPVGGPEEDWQVIVGAAAIGNGGAVELDSEYKWFIKRLQERRMFSSFKSR